MRMAEGAVNPLQHQVGKRLVRLKRNDFGAMPQPNPANSVSEIQNISTRPVFLFRQPLHVKRKLTGKPVSGSAVAEYRFERRIQSDAAGVSQHDIDRCGQRWGC